MKFPRCKLAVEFDPSLLPPPIDQTYQGRYQALRDEVNIGIEASDRGDVVDAEIIFGQLKERLIPNPSHITPITKRPIRRGEWHSP